MRLGLSVIFLITLSLLFSTTTVASDYGKIEGTVVESASNIPLEGVNIVLVGTLMGAATDSKGYFIISKVAPGYYTLIITAIGYKEVSQEVIVEPNKSTTIELALETTVVELGGLVVTAGRYSQSVRDIPVSMATLSSKDIMRRNVSSLNEALKYVPGVHTMGNQINIRGASGFSRGIGTRVLVLVDGVPFIRSDDNDVDWDAIAPTQVEQVEVMKGAGSALYGSSALGGVVNIILKDPSQHYNFFIRTFTGFYDKPKYQSWMWTTEPRHYEGTTASYSGKIFGIGTWISTTWKNNTGFRENDDNETINIMSKFSSQLNPDLRFDLLAGYSKKRFGLFLFWKSYYQATLNGGDAPGTATRSLMVETYIHPSITHVVNSKFSYTFKGRLMFTSSEDNLEILDPNSVYEEGVYRHSSASSYGGDLQCNLQYAPQGILVFGTDIQKFNINSSHFGKPDAYSIAGFLQNEHRFFNKIKSTVGLRYDAQIYQDYPTMQGWNPKLGLNFVLSPSNTLRLSIAKGFRAPSPAEKYISTFTNQVKISPNPELNPEHSLSSEIGIDKILFGNINLDVAAYNTDFWDLIEIRPEQNWVTVGDHLLPELKFANVTRARVQGIETSLRAEWVKDFFTTGISYSYMFSKDLSRNPDGSPSKDYGKVLKYRPRNLLLLSSDLMYRGASLGVDFRYVSEIERVDEFQKIAIKDLDVTPAAYITDVRLGYQWGNFKIHFFINNIFQNYYIEHPACLGAYRNYNLQIDFIS